MPRFVIIVDDEKHHRLTPDLLKQWAKQALHDLNLKVMVGSLDPMFNKELCVVIDILAKSEIIWEKEKIDNNG